MLPLHADVRFPCNICRDGPTTDRVGFLNCGSVWQLPAWALSAKSEYGPPLADVLGSGGAAGLILRDDARRAIRQQGFHLANETVGFESHLNVSAELFECPR